MALWRETPLCDGASPKDLRHRPKASRAGADYASQTVADAKTFRRLALALPDVEEGKSYGTPSWRVRGSPRRLRDDDTVGVAKVEKAEKQLLIEAEPDVFFEAALQRLRLLARPPRRDRG